jgi:hypothetical protein
MSAQKTALVCLILLVVLLGHAAVQLLPQSSAAVIVRQHHVEVSICVMSERNESCTLALKVDSWW